MSRAPNVRPDRTPEHLRWTRVAIEPRKSMKGWIAGPVFGCEGHPVPAFKPCHALFSSGKRTCPWCAIEQYKVIRYQGYLPLYDERLKRVVVCINLDNTVTCDSFSLLQPVVVAKGQFPTSPVNVRKEEWTSIKPSGPTVRHTPQDILPWLVEVLWKKENLQEFAKDEAQPAVEQPAVEQPAVEQPAVEQPESGSKALAKMMRDRGWKKSALFFDPDTQAEPSVNGNGKHKKKK